MPRHNRSTSFSRTRSSGVVLIVVMVMLVLIGFMSAAVMRGAINSDQISNNNRAQMQAGEAAQLALRFCEAELMKEGSALISIEAAPADGRMLWEIADTWTGSQKAVKVPNEALKTSGMTATLRRPECLAQYAQATAPSPVILTARAFSGDYTENSTTKKISSGSVVWLQSTFLLKEEVEEEVDTP